MDSKEKFQGDLIDSIKRYYNGKYKRMVLTAFAEDQNGEFARFIIGGDFTYDDMAKIIEKPLKEIKDEE